MTEDLPPTWFWELLESANRSLRSSCRSLEQLPQDRLREYQSVFDEAKRTVDPYFDWEASVPYIREWPSEDGADDFSAWVVTQGREFYEQVRNQPGNIQRYLDLFEEVEMGQHPELNWDETLDRDEYRGYQSADGVAIPIYRKRFGDEIGG